MSAQSLHCAGNARMPWLLALEVTPGMSCKHASARARLQVVCQVQACICLQIEVKLLRGCKDILHFWHVQVDLLLGWHEKEISSKLHARPCTGPCKLRYTASETSQPVAVPSNNEGLQQAAVHWTDNLRQSCQTCHLSSMPMTATPKIAAYFAACELHLAICKLQACTHSLHSIALLCSVVGAVYRLMTL